jgi:MarR-like DNA-binding transcriptional regulator SgrR of sgrS sRNA
MQGGLVMASSRLINNEVAYAIRTWLASVPSLGASAEQRSYFQLLKAETFELLAAADPSVAAQALQLADQARREAHAINLDY